MRTFIFALTFILCGLDLAAQTDTIDTVVRRCWGVEEKAKLRLYPSAPVKKPSSIGKFFHPVRTYRLEKRLILPVALSFSAGGMWGTHEVLEHRNASFFRVIPGANARFWGPDSWKNKYWGFNPENGRNRVPIYFTDAKHLLASGTQVFTFSAGATIVLGEDRPVIHYLIDAGISFLSYTAGNVLFYNVIFR